MQNYFFRRILLSLVSGICAGVVALVFIVSIDAAIRIRSEYPMLLWLLPVGGFCIGWLFHQFGKDVVAGTTLILEEIHSPKKVTPAQMTPLIFVSSVITQFVGASAGREGAIVQMSASLSDQISRFFKITTDERRSLLITGAGAGFGAAIGAPFAGILFGIEAIQHGRLKVWTWIECIIASLTAYGIIRIAGLQYTVYPDFLFPGFSFSTLCWIALAGVIFGLMAKFFSYSTHVIESLHRRWVKYAPLRPMLAGLLLVLLFSMDGTDHYVGLGLHWVQDALQNIAPIQRSIYKSLFTSISVGSGFKGGEFVPLVYIGAALGSALGLLLPVAFQILARVGFASVFAGVSHAPLACTVMAMELFGYQYGPYALVSCFIAHMLKKPIANWTKFFGRSVG